MVVFREILEEEDGYIDFMIGLPIDDTKSAAWIRGWLKAQYHESIGRLGQYVE